MSSPVEDPRIGSIVENRYRIVRRIAVGSMSIVYRGQRLHLRRPVAIKFLRPSLKGDQEFLKRFEIEAKTMSQLSHPNCISVIDFGVTDAPYIIMEWVRGQTLKELAETYPIDSNRAVHIIRQVLAGLAHAHKRGIVHRDIKPANIMLTDMTCIGDHVCVFDFGLARLAEEGRFDPKDSDTVAGTLDYMSPEHLSEREVDWRADIFSTGVVLYQLLTGCKPFTARTPAELLHMHDAPPKPLSAAHMGGAFSTELENVVAKSLARYPEDRYQSAIDFADALTRVPEAVNPDLAQPSMISTAPSEPPQRKSPSFIPATANAPLRRTAKRKIGLVAALVAFSALGFCLGAWWGSLPPRQVQKKAADTSASNTPHERDSEE